MRVTRGRSACSLASAGLPWSSGSFHRTFQPSTFNAFARCPSFLSARRTYAYDESRGFGEYGFLFDKDAKDLDPTTLWKSEEEADRDILEDDLVEHGFSQEFSDDEVSYDEGEEGEDDEEVEEEDLVNTDEEEGEPQVPKKYWRQAIENMTEALDESEDEEVHVDPEWHRDFSESESANLRQGPEEFSAVTVPTSWYAYTPHQDTILPPTEGFESNINAMGIPIEEMGHEELVYMGRHTKVTKGGRIFTFSAMIIDGDGQGTAGWGYGRGDELADALIAARKDLLKRLVHIDRFEDRTLAEPIRAKYGKSICQLFVWPTQGVWIPRSSPHMESVFRAFGLENVAGKFIGSRNRKNCIKALFKAIQMAEHPQYTAKKLGVKWFNAHNVWRPGQPRVWSY